MGGACSTYGERICAYGVLVGGGNLRERDNLEDPGVDGGYIKMDLQGVGWELWTGSIWLRIETGGGLLCL